MQTDIAPDDHAEPARTRSRRWAVRRRRDRLVAGLASGLGDHWGIPVAYVRAAFVVAALSGGVGIAAYMVGWALTLERDEDAEPPELPSQGQKAGLLLIYVGALLTSRALGLWFSDEITFPAALLSFGTAAMWDRSDPATRSRIAKLTASGNDEVTRIRVIAGGLLMLAGFTYFVGSIDALADVGPVLLAVAMTVTGSMILFGPLVWRMAQNLGDERRGRIRSDERAEMAAHLHDSVLQTLALIQRSDDPKRMVTLARGQERELREWLYRRGESTAGNDLSSAVRDQAARVEHGHDIPIDVVAVGDAQLNDALLALSQAAGEAMTNAAKHSGAEKVSVYLEVTDDAAEVYVGDTGRGFIVDTLDGEGRGIPDSIIGRMQRHGGEATVTSTPEEGTEVHLRMPRE
jgi:signal transduction histidine kinase/phage shock protein PspC (stress-responsive transcriptional regulator)